MTDTANAPEREAGTPGPHEPDYKTAMLYHSDRADAYMGERDALTAELAKLRADLAEAQAKIARLTEVLTYYNDQFCEGFCSDVPAGFTNKDMENDCSGCRARAALQENANE